MLNPQTHATDFHHKSHKTPCILSSHFSAACLHLCTFLSVWMEFYQHAAAVTAERREVALCALRWFELYEEVESCCITSCSCCPRLLDGAYAWAHTHTCTHHPALSLRNSEEERGLLVRVISFFMVRHSWYMVSPCTRTHDLQIPTLPSACVTHNKVKRCYKKSVTCCWARVSDKPCS